MALQLSQARTHTCRNITGRIGHGGRFLRREYDRRHAMTLDELLAREAIRKTMAKYTVSGDRLRIDDFASCFTEDGVIEASSAPGKVEFRYVGRNEIRAWQNRWRDGGAGQETVHSATFL